MHKSEDLENLLFRDQAEHTNLVDYMKTCTLIYEDFEPSKTATVVSKAKWNYYLPKLMNEKL